jgi:hypothetical protein
MTNSGLKAFGAMGDYLSPMPALGPSCVRGISDWHNIPISLRILSWRKRHFTNNPAECSLYPSHNACAPKEGACAEDNASQNSDCAVIPLPRFITIRPDTASQQIQ